MTSEKKAQSGVRTRWVIVALCLSLALNLLIVGYIAGSVARHGGTGPDARTLPALGAFGAPYMIALPREDRRAVLRALQRDGEGRLPGRQARRDMFDDVLIQLRADPFDQAALEASVRRQADVSVAVQQRLQRAWLQKVAAMEASERQSYADQVESLLARRARLK